MVTGFLRNGPTTGGFDFSQSFLTRLMTVVNDQESFRFGNPVYLPKKGRGFSNAEKDINRTDRIRDVVRNPGSVALREYGKNIVQILRCHLAFYRIDSKSLNVDSIDPPASSDEFGESNGISSRTTTIIDNRHVLAYSKRDNSLIDRRVEQVLYRHDDTHQPESKVWHSFKCEHGQFLSHRHQLRR